MKPKKRNSNNDPRTTLKKKNPVFDNIDKRPVKVQREQVVEDSRDLMKTSMLQGRP